METGKDPWDSPETYKEEYEDPPLIFNGEGVLIYPGTIEKVGFEGPVASMRLKWIREIVTARKLTPLPNASDFVAGVVNIRGDVVSVLDTASLLQGRKSSQKWERIILIDTSGAPVGLAVESVSAVQAVMPESFMATPETDSETILGKYIYCSAIYPAVSCNNAI